MIPLFALALLTKPLDTLRFRPEDIDSRPAAMTRVEERTGRLIIELPVIEVPAERTILTPVFRVSVPFQVSLYGFAAEVVDETGRAVPADRLHHFMLTDPKRRQLFAPLALPIFGASKESPRPVLPSISSGCRFPRAAATSPCRQPGSPAEADAGARRPLVRATGMDLSHCSGPTPGRWTPCPRWVGREAATISTSLPAAPPTAGKGPP